METKEAVLQNEYEAAKSAVIEARKTLDKRESAYNRAVKKPQYLALVGKTFKYPRNCYSCPEKESDYWPEYAMVVGVNKELHLKTIEFSTDSHGRFQYKKGTWWSGIASGYVPCPKSEYVREFKRQTMRLILPEAPR